MRNTVQEKKEESQRRIQEAFQLAKKRPYDFLKLSDIIENCADSDFEKETVFGFNVRLKNDDAIIPLLGGGVWMAFQKSNENFGHRIKQTIPKVFEKSHLRIIEFALTSDNKVEENESLSSTEIEKIKKADSFAVLQKKFLFPNDERVYFWISRECGNLEKKGSQYLSNILVISRKKEHLEFVRNRHIDFIRFLFQMEMAYATIVERERKVEAIKSAVAAMMSRNLSHNLGSHYLFYTKMYLESLANSFGEKGPDIRGAAKVLGYMQARMDYLATIVSNNKYPYGSVNFKSQILDELTVDDFSKRHYGTEQDAEFKKRLDDGLMNLGIVQKIVRDIKRLYNDCHSLDGAVFTKKREKIGEALSQLHLAVGEVDNSNIYNRTTNYLLTYLIKSENFSRPKVLEQNETESFRHLWLHVRLWDDDSGEFVVFTGSNEPSRMKEEGPIKDKLSKINLALPGGTMSSHAFYSILENFIRNSAKYSWNGKQVSELRITIALRVNEANHTVECTIYDNKRDALVSCDSYSKDTLLDHMINKLGQTRVLKENHMVDQENKGLKEMLFSAIWLNANESDKRFAEIISSLEEMKPRERINQIAKYAFRFVSVGDDGFDSDDCNSANLGIRFVLPLFTNVEPIEDKSIRDFLKLHTDVVEVPDLNTKASSPINRPYSKIFPRVFSCNQPVRYKYDDIVSKIERKCTQEEYEAVLKLKQAINNNLGNIDNYSLCISSVPEPGFNMGVTQDKLISFDTHLSTNTSKAKLKEHQGKYAYIDTISGNNFTKTIEGLFISGLGGLDQTFKTYSDYFLDLKIKESGLTRITIIDERLFNSIRWGVVQKKLDDSSILDKDLVDFRSTEIELSMKNIRVLNYLNSGEVRKKDKSVLKVRGLPFYGNKFYPMGPCKNSPNATHFLSIHLGLIEKLLKSNAKSLVSLFGSIEGNPLAEKRINKLMSLLESTFGKGTKNGVHICIHSGRGDYSKELEGPLKNYPFISLASLENAFNNSKYLLSQLFYNTIYIGKGEVNQ